MEFKDIINDGRVYNDGYNVYVIEHFQMLKNGACNAYCIIFLKMNIEQENNNLHQNIDNLKKLSRKDYLFRTQPYTIQQLGKTTKDNFEEFKNKYLDNLELSLKENAEEYNFQTGKVLFGGWQEKKFFWNAEMRDFFNEKKGYFKGVK